MADQQQQAAPAAAAVIDGDTKKLLEQILEKQQQAAERDSMTTVKFGDSGLECSDLAGLWRLANMYARSTIVPAQYQAKPENCLIALQMAQRCRMDAFAFMQSSYIVHGRPGIEGKLVIAMLNASGKIKGRMRFEFDGEGEKRCCTAIVTDKESGQEIKMPLPWSIVKAEGWEKKEGSKWRTMPDQMFRYRSAVFLVRAHYPEVMMGLTTVEELEELPATETLPVGRVSLADIGKANGNGHKDAEPEPAPPDDGMTDEEKAAIIAAEKEEQQREPVTAGRRAGTF